MFNLNLVRVTELRTVKPDSIRSDYTFRFADGVVGYLSQDGRVDFRIETTR